jgi:hypothetical protein
MDEKIAAWRRELKDLEKAVPRKDPPLAPRTRAIAEAQIATLHRQIAAIKHGHQAAE